MPVFIPSVVYQMSRRDLGSGWKSYEVIHKTTGATPVSTAIAAGPDTAAVVKKILLVQETGWPEALKLHFGPKGKHRIVKKDDVIWLLKCTPSCWRLYFYIYKAKKWIIYVHAVCKKKSKEDPNDAVQARSVYEKIVGGSSGITEFPFPTS
jgi:hypothetical protein